MFRRSTSPPPGTSDSNKPFNDWKRRVGQKTRLKLGLAHDFKDDVTGNVDMRLDRFHNICGKVSIMKGECEKFCADYRIYLHAATAKLSFLHHDTPASRLCAELIDNQVVEVVEYFLSNEIESPINILSKKTDEIEQLLHHRNEVLLLDYQHHMRKLEVLQEKAAASSKRESLCDDIKIRQGKVEASALRLKEGNLFIEANIAAYEFTYSRLCKRVSNMIFAIQKFVGQAVSAGCGIASEENGLSADQMAVMDQLTGYQIMLQERRVMSVKASLDAVAISGSGEGVSTIRQPRPSSRPVSRSPSPPPPGSAPASYSQRAMSRSFDEVAPAELEDYTYALNLHMGVLGEVFGHPLQDLSEMPAVVVDTLEFLRRLGLQTEGLFRVSGDEDEIADLRRHYDEGKGGDVLRSKQRVSDTDLHTAASLLKLYFRSLPEPLIPRACYRSLCDAVTADNGNFVELARTILHPPGVTVLNLRIIAHLFRLLHELTKHTAENKMTKENLAIVFAPSLLRPEGAQELGLYELQNGIGIVKNLIEHAISIFEDICEIHPLVE